MPKWKSSTIFKDGITSILLLFVLTSCFTPNTGPLTSDDHLWLQQHKGKLEVLFGYEAPPNAYHDDDGQYIGLLVDFLREIENHIGVDFSFRNFASWDELIKYSRTGRNFIIVGIARTDDRAKYLSFTSPLLKVPYVIVTRKDDEFVTMSKLSGNKVCTVANYAVNDFIALNFPQIHPQSVVDNLVGLRQVSTGGCDALIVNQMYASYLIESQGITNLKIAGESGYHNRLSAAASINDPRLFNILEKAVDHIGTDRQKELYRKWVSPGAGNISHSVLLVLTMIAIFGIVLLVLFWLWSLSLRKQVLKQTRQIREGKKRLELAIKAAKLGFYDWNAEKGLLHWDAKMDDIFGLSRESNIDRNDYFFNVLHTNDKDRVIADFEKMMDPGNNTTSHTNEYRIQLNNGQVKHIETYGFHFRNKEGAVMRILGICQDISERKKSEKEKERLQRELQQAHKMEAIGQLTGGIAHDFNNILGVIMGYTGMAIDRYGDEVPDKMRTYLETVIKASEQARDLVAQMLAFSRSSNGDAQPLQITPLVKENVKMLHSILPSSIRINLKCDDDLPSILMDPAKLQQLMMNLCVNARDAMVGVGSLTIYLGWQRNIDTECTACHKRVLGNWIELSVSDTGTGMTPDIVARLFEPFYTTKEVGKGTGMGLSVLQGIVSSHDGHILVETEPGKGSTFRMLFPPLVKQVNETYEAEKYPSSDELPQGEGRHVLVLDDEAGLAEYVASLLVLNGYQVTVKTDSQEALNLFKQDPGKFALLVTDQTMPKLTGVALINQLRVIRPEFPVILCTGYSEDIDEESAEAMGIRYLGKPIDAIRLVQSAGELVKMTN